MMRRPMMSAVLSDTASMASLFVRSFCVRALPRKSGGRAFALPRRQMVPRWVAAGVLEAVKGFRRLKVTRRMPKLVAASRARDQELGLVRNEVEKVA